MLIQIFASFLLLAGMPAEKVETFGAGISGRDTVAIAEVLQKPREFEGKTVRVQGTVNDVCAMMGCWLELKSESADKIRVKVEDGEIVFPLSVKGHVVIAEGVVEILSMDRDEFIAWKKHLAEEKGESFDPASVGEGPYETVQLRGTGAVTVPE